MSAAEWTPRPYVVGEENVYVVGLRGIVSEVTKTTLTINGTVLPRVMGEETGVRYMSMIWPDSDPCDRKHCDSTCDSEPADSHAQEALETLAAIVREQHEDTHNGAIQFCRNRLCRELYDMAVDA